MSKQANRQRRHRREKRREQRAVSNARVREWLADTPCILCDGKGVHECPGGFVPASHRSHFLTSESIMPGLVDASIWTDRERTR